MTDSPHASAAAPVPPDAAPVTRGTTAPAIDPVNPVTPMATFDETGPTRVSPSTIDGDPPFTRPADTLADSARRDNITTPPAQGIKHWRSFGHAEWRHVKDGAIGLVLGSILPVVLFYVTYQTWGFSAAVVLVLIWSALVFLWHFRRTGRADVFSATTFAFACIKATAGLVSQNTFLYLAWPSLENLIYGTAFLGSALAGRPLLALYAQRLYPIPPHVRASDAFRAAFIITSAAWLCGHSLRAVVRLWLLAHLPLEMYLIADTVAGWPINVSLVAFTVWFPLRALRKAGFMSLHAVDLDPVDSAELVVEETVPTTV